MAVGQFLAKGRTHARNAALRVGPLLSRRRLTGPSATLLGTSLATNVLRIANTVVLTRLLAPQDYGLVGIIMSIFFVIGMLTDTGCYAFLLRHERGLDPGFVDVIWTIHLLRGVANAALLSVLAIPIAALLDKPALAPLLAVAAISLAIDGSISLSTVTALRLNMVRRLSVIDFAAFLTQILVGLIAAWFLRNAWAIIIATIAFSATRAVASYAVFPNASQRIRFDRAIGGELWRFSRMIAASSTLTLIIGQMDRLVLARVFTLQQFGIYSIAGSLAATPTAIVHLYASRIIFPPLAEIWRIAPERVGTTFYQLRGIVFYGYLFAAGGLLGSSTLVVRLLYDPRYAGAAFYLHLLAISTVMAMLTHPQNELLMVIGRLRTTFETNVVRLCWLTVAAIAGYFLMGFVGIVVALALVEAVAYCYGAYRLSQLGFFSVRHDLIALGTAGIGVLVGTVGSAAVMVLLPIR